MPSHTTTELPLRRRAPRRPELQVMPELKSGMVTAGALHDVPSKSWPVAAHTKLRDSMLLKAAFWELVLANCVLEEVDRVAVLELAEAIPAEVDVDSDAVAMDVEVVSALTEDDTPATLAVMRQKIQ